MKLTWKSNCNSKFATINEVDEHTTHKHCQIQNLSENQAPKYMSTQHMNKKSSSIANEQDNTQTQNLDLN